MYYEKGIPVMRNDVIEALRKAGVDNIQYFDAVLRDPRSLGDIGANVKILIV